MQALHAWPQVNKVGIYCRLSREDGDSFESSSIQSQKEMLTDYALSRDWSIYDYYIDDGYSGTNFDRPAFKRLIADCEAKRVNIIITKDLSRLGRNYLDTGRYTEEYFPLNNIRYIAVNDNFDTAQGDNDFAPFKNIINEWYAKDISKKVKSTFQLKIKKGELPCATVPIYGYMFKEGTFHRILDPETAPIVAIIFEKYLLGETQNEIIKYLYDHKVYNPGYYLYKKYGWYKDRYLNYTEKKAITWSKSQLQRIISKREEYAGNLILGKTTKISFKLKKRVKNSIDKCKVVEDAYEPIITKEMLKKANIIAKYHSNDNIPLGKNKFKDLLYCSSCGTSLKLRIYKSNGKETPRYTCRCETCKSHANIKLESAEIIITNIIKDIYSKIIEHEDKFLKYVEKYQRQKDKKAGTKAEREVNKEIKTCNERLDKLQILIEKLYESRIVEDIPPTVYEKMMKKYRDEVETINLRLDELSRIISESKSSEVNYRLRALEFLEKMKNVNINDISRKNLVEIIDQVQIERVGPRAYNIHYRTTVSPFMIEAYMNEEEI